MNQVTRRMGRTLCLSGLLFALLLSALPLCAFQRNAPKARVTSQRARRLALSAYPGRVISGPTLAGKGASRYYSVQIRSGRQRRTVRVNAMTGKITNVVYTKRR